VGLPDVAPPGGAVLIAEGEVHGLLCVPGSEREPDAPY
jgi:hypothetical protein